jgi:hypothetical protein
MPTGYTDMIKADTTFAAFAMRCARAFGACIEMRDDPLDAPITEFHPGDYHLKSLEEAKARREAVRKMTSEEAWAEIEKHNADVRAYVKRENEQSAATRARYERMLALVEAWTPPTPNHENMKKFMREQITESIKFDCHDYSEYDWYKPFAGDAADWRTAELSKAQKDIEYHEKHYQEEVERCNKNNAWVKALRESLMEPATT